MQIIIKNSLGNEISRFEIDSEYGYEQFVYADSLKGCNIVNEHQVEEDRNGDKTLHFTEHNEIIIQLNKN